MQSFPNALEAERKRHALARRQFPIGAHVKTIWRPRCGVACRRRRAPAVLKIGFCSIFSARRARLALNIAQTLNFSVAGAARPVWPSDSFNVGADWKRSLHLGAVLPFRSASSAFESLI